MEKCTGAETGKTTGIRKPLSGRDELWTDEGYKQTGRRNQRYLKTVPTAVHIYKNNPIYTYSYFKELYTEILPQLTEYMEMDISDTMKWNILNTIHNCYLSINNMDRAKEYWTQCVVLSNELDLDMNGVHDEYGGN